MKNTLKKTRNRNIKNIAERQKTDLKCNTTKMNSKYMTINAVGEIIYSKSFLYLRKILSFKCSGFTG